MESGPTSISDLQPGAFIAGRYEILGRLGNGGMGIVFKALDKELDDTIALKLLHPHLAQDETVYRRFRNEVLVARALTHPNIVRTHDMGRAEAGFSYISMEYVGGKSLREMLQAEVEEQRRGFVLDYAVEVLYSVLSGVSYAHGKGIIHRDLKPANVLLSDDGEVKLADFGTARILGMDTSITRMGQVVGTPDYMSPEQIRGEELTPHCDIYSLGIIAYELITGQRPFVADTPVAVAFKHLNEPVPAIPSKIATVPSWYTSLIAIATSKKTEDRFSSVAEMAHYLLEHNPMLKKNSGVFPMDGGQFKSTGGRERVPGDASADTVSSSIPKRFELGEVHPTSSGGWTLSADAQEASPAREAPVTAPPPVAAVAPRTRSRTMLILLPLIVLVAVWSGFRFFEPLRAEVVTYASSLEQDTPLRSALIAAFQIEPQSLQSSSVAAANDEPSRSARDELDQELLALVAPEELPVSDKDAAGKVDTTPAEPNSEKDPQQNSQTEATSSTQAAVQEPAGAAKDANGSTSVSETPATVGQSAAAVEPSPSATAAPASAAVEASTPMPTPSPTPAPTPEKPTSAKLVFYKGSTKVDEDSIRFSDLSAMSWKAELVGLPAEFASQKRTQLIEQTKINVFDPKTAQVIASQSARGVRAQGNELLIDGRLSDIARKIEDIGSYRFDLVFDGEVLSSREVSLYKASVSLSMPSSPANGAAGGRVAIVRGAQVVEPRAPVQAPATPDVTPTIEAEATATPARALPSGAVRESELPVGQGVTTTASANDKPRVVLQPRSGRGLAEPYRGGTGGLGLPPARGHTSASVEPTASEAAPQPAARETWSGSLRIAIGTQPEQSRAMILNLQRSGAGLSGSANIAGFDTFNVTGEVVVRGVVLYLSNAQYSIRLSGGIPDSTMKGIAEISQLNQRGTWSVTKN